MWYNLGMNNKEKDNHWPYKEPFSSKKRPGKIILSEKERNNLANEIISSIFNDSNNTLSLEGHNRDSSIDAKGEKLSSEKELNFEEQARGEIRNAFDSFFREIKALVGREGIKGLLEIGINANSLEKELHIFNDEKIIKRCCETVLKIFHNKQDNGLGIRNWANTVVETALRKEGEEIAKALDVIRNRKISSGEVKIGKVIRRKSPESDDVLSAKSEAPSGEGEIVLGNEQEVSEDDLQEQLKETVRGIVNSEIEKIKNESLISRGVKYDSYIEGKIKSQWLKAGELTGDEISEIAKKYLEERQKVADAVTEDILENLELNPGRKKDEGYISTLAFLWTRKKIFEYAEEYLENKKVSEKGKLDFTPEQQEAVDLLLEEASGYNEEIAGILERSGKAKFYTAENISNLIESHLRELIFKNFVEDKFFSDSDVEKVVKHVLENLNK